MIYFIQSGENGPIKIGVAGSVPRRIAGLQTGNPEELRLVGVLPEESDLHREFADLSLRGEWFAPDDRLLGFIERYTLREVPPSWGDVAAARERHERGSDVWPRTVQEE